MYFLFYTNLNSVVQLTGSPIPLSGSDQKSFMRPEIEKTVILTDVASLLFIFGASRVLN